MAKQTRTVSHAQWVKFRFEWIHPQNGMSSHWTGALEKFWGKVRRGVGEGLIILNHFKDIENRQTKIIIHRYKISDHLFRGKNILNTIH